MTACTLCAAGDEPLPPTVEFNRDIRPILSENCYQCHGPDRAQRKAELRLDAEADAFADRGGYRLIEPNKLDESELFQRITAEDPTEHMPPPKSGKTLSARQVALVRRWIEQGAKWQKHWSLIPPSLPELPQVQHAGWPRNAIDRFVLARLEREGLRPSPEADKATLIRRASLDLTGLPPAPEEIDRFLLDNRPDAFERLVDRLLASARYGERMAIRWLDAARYADTNGYQSDGERFMWSWRDWVIDAYNRNLPFDRFTVEQLAGDLLPNPTLDQKIATGFNRNHRGNAEGGIIPEEYAVEYVVDRVDTTSTVWLGMTVQCARCHDHKFDPISQKEFYQLFAFFNNVPEKGRAVKFGNSPPVIPAPTPQQAQELAELDAKVAAASRRFDQLGPAIASAQRDWEASVCDMAKPIDWTISEGLIARFGFDEASKALADASISLVPGQIGQAAELDGRRFIDAGDVARFGFYDKFSCGAWVFAADGQGGTILSRMTDAAQGDGYSLVLSGGKIQVNLVKRWLDDATRVETEHTLAPGRWHHVMFTYDGSRVASGVKIYVDGAAAETKVLLDELNQSFASPEPLRIGAGNGPDGRFRGLIDDVRIYDRALKAEEAAIVATPETISQIVQIDSARRSPSQSQKLRAHFLAEAAPEPMRNAWKALTDLQAKKSALVESFPTTMVMEEMPIPRKTHVLRRGEYDKPGDRVDPGVPSCLPPMPEGLLRNRLALAQWLVNPANPLTARVAVNRLWQMVFGTGLVKTVDDFGAQGEWPSHPELLDWLATQYIRAGWDTKAMLKTIVTSATYRQTSRANAELLRKDPENRLLARGPRLRLSAEMIRDQALAASGLLVERIGGPSVKPYQPEGLWKELAEIKEYPQDHGPNLYRRSLYTFWKRTVSPPEMITFDASTRETCVVRESRTNTPLQALTLLNDVTFVEAARALAERVLREAGPSPEARLSYAFRLCSARLPRPEELKILLADLAEHEAHFREHPGEARELLRVGESKPDDRFAPAELASYTAVANLILNLEETITKQ